MIFSFEKKSAPNRYREMAIQVIEHLESPERIARASDAINQVSERNEHSLPIEQAFDEETSAIIRAAYAGNETFVLAKIREWFRLRLRCNIEEAGDAIILSWDDPSLFAPSEPMRDGTGE